jgi:regulator of protease activity HflC (stomatin/prohibitin superfamily)
MIFFIIGVVAALFALAVLLLAKEYKNSAIIPAVVAVVMIGISCVSYVPTGYTGIVTTFGKVEDGTKDAGTVFKQPWQSIVKMDNRVKEMSMDLSAFSSDIQEVATSVSVGYRINQANAMTIYKSVGKKYEDTLITPRVLETVKAVVAHYDASSLISNRDAVAAQMDAKLREVLAEYNIDLQYISVTNFDFTDTFTDAVEAKVKAQQEKEKAETDAEKRRVEAQATADADLIAANAEAEKSKVAADAELYVAEKKAEANRALNDSLNSNLLEYYKITNVDSLWNGELPAYVGDGNSIPIINGIN